jgi:hypothetical protein
MADPGTAVGVVSLGLQVAQGLVKYYSHFKTYDNDIAHAHQRLKRLHDTFAALEGPLSRPELSGNPDSECVRKSLNSCKQELLKLKELVEKCDGVSIPHTTSLRVQKVKSKVLYPFRKSTLADVEKWVRLAQADLDSAVHVLQL